MISSIVFDVGNVLLDYNPRRVIRRLGGDAAAEEAVMAALFDAPEWIRGDEGTIAQQEMIEAAVSRIPQYEELARQAFQQWVFDMTPIAGMEQLVEELREKGLPLYLLSNFGVRFFDICDRLPLLSQMDGRIISCEWKLLKPQPEIYRLLLQKFRLSPEETLFIDDRPENIEGAKREGMQGQLFTGANELRARLAAEGLLD
ncbi:MAG: HAD family phosphatase [Provencibacterium sp.]|jgi:putative hydrolase of the HAD superfamily|nr:HAD family phosphatase [Provencibacterium sp.]